MNIVPCLTWVRRGVAKKTPDKVQLDGEELRRIIEETKEELENREEEELLEEEEEEGAAAASAVNKHSKSPQKDIKHRKRKHEEAGGGDSEDIVNKYGLDDYDDDGGKKFNPLKGLGDLSYYATPSDDPYITLKDVESDEEDFEILPSDNLVVSGKAEKDACFLEIYVYNEDQASLYCHHDIILPSFPLAVEWLNYDVGEDQPGNFVAVGTMEPVIDIWDVDLVDCLEPCATLGTKKKKKSKKKVANSGHTDAILDLSWNSSVRTALASASADFTVGLWDLYEGKLVSLITQHKEKAQCVEWHPKEPQSLLSGSFDNTVKMYDCRNPNKNCKSWTFGGEIERILWDMFSPQYFYAVTDGGKVYYLDSRQDKPVFTLSAHTGAVTGVALSSRVPGLLVTTSEDKSFKVWDTQNNKPSLVLEKDLKLGKLHCVRACPEAPFVFAIGGEKEMKIWDIRESGAVRKHFEDRAPSGVTMAAMEGEGQMDEAMDNLSIDTTDTTTKKKKKKKKKKKPSVEES
ncbi:hypothetical protein ScPMuIL_013409 [Solemya velum]